MFGPVGIVGSAGAGPGPAGTNSQIKVALSCSQSHGSPVVELSRSLPLIIFALPDEISATHNSMPLSLVLRNERCVPSGEKCTFERFACGGAATFTSLPSEIFFRVMAKILAVRWGPFVRGSIRTP